MTIGYYCFIHVSYTFAEVELMKTAVQ